MHRILGAHTSTRKTQRKPRRQPLFFLLHKFLQTHNGGQFQVIGEEKDVDEGAMRGEYVITSIFYYY